MPALAGMLLCLTGCGDGAPLKKSSAPPPKPAVEVVVTVHASEAPIVVKTVPKPKPVKAEKRKGEPIYTAKSPVDRLTVPEDFPMTRRSTPQLLEDPVTIAQPSSDGAQRWPAGSARSA